MNKSKYKYAIELLEKELRINRSWKEEYKVPYLKQEEVEELQEAIGLLKSNAKNTKASEKKVIALFEMGENIDVRLISHTLPEFKIISPEEKYTITMREGDVPPEIPQIRISVFRLAFVKTIDDNTIVAFYKFSHFDEY